MTDTLADTRSAKGLVRLCFLVYFTSYITRINYAAIIAEIIRAEGISKSAASVATTAIFVAYGVGQLGSGFLGDRVSPVKLVFGGLLASSALNMLMPLVSGTYAMTAVWFLNGLAQAMLWPPLVKILSSHLRGDAYRQACVSVSVASAVGTVAVYALSPAVIALLSWHWVFWLSGVLGLAVSLFWLRGAGELCSAPPAAPSPAAAEISGVKLTGLVIPSGLLFILGGIVLQGMLRDGVTTWLPSYLGETFRLGSSVSILSAVVLPFVSIAALRGSAALQRRLIPNELTCAGTLFLLACTASSVLAVFSARSVAVSLLLAAVVTGCAHGINLILVCLIPRRFEYTGKVAYISGLLNFFTYVGSAVSAYGVARLSESFGWRFTIESWAVIALLGVLLCALCVRRWRAFCKS